MCKYCWNVSTRFSSRVTIPKIGQFNLSQSKSVLPTEHKFYNTTMWNVLHNILMQKCQIQHPGKDWSKLSCSVIRQCSWYCWNLKRIYSFVDTFKGTMYINQNQATQQTLVNNQWFKKFQPRPRTNLARTVLPTPDAIYQSSRWNDWKFASLGKKRP